MLVCKAKKARPDVGLADAGRTVVSRVPRHPRAQGIRAERTRQAGRLRITPQALEGRCRTRHGLARTVVDMALLEETELNTREHYIWGSTQVQPLPVACLPCTADRPRTASAHGPRGSRAAACSAEAEPATTRPAGRFARRGRMPPRPLACTPRVVRLQQGVAIPARRAGPAAGASRSPSRDRPCAPAPHAHGRRWPRSGRPVAPPRAAATARGTGPR